MESGQRKVNNLRDFHQFWQLNPSCFFKETDFPSEHILEKSWDLESEAVGLSSDLDLQALWNWVSHSTALDLRFLLCWFEGSSVNICESALYVLRSCKHVSISLILLSSFLLGSHLDNTLVMPSAFFPRFWSHTAWVSVMYRYLMLGICLNLCLAFLICKMGTIKVPPSSDCWED